jgi:hypothetical protein
MEVAHPGSRTTPSPTALCFVVATVLLQSFYPHPAAAVSVYALDVLICFSELRKLFGPACWPLVRKKPAATRAATWLAAVVGTALWTATIGHAACAIIAVFQVLERPPSVVARVSSWLESLRFVEIGAHAFATVAGVCAIPAVATICIGLLVVATAVNAGSGKRLH